MKQEILKKIYSNDRIEKRNAIKALSGFNVISESVMDYLIQLLNNDDPAIIDAAIDTLINIDNDKLFKKLVALLNTSNIRVRSYVFEILNQKGQKNIKELLKKLNSKDPNERKFAVDILGEINIYSCEKDIRGLINDTDANVRFAVVEALGKLGVKNSAKFLLEQLKIEKEIWVKYAIIEALNKIGDVRIAKELVNMPLNGDIYTFDAIIETVSNIGDESIAESLFQIFPLVGKREKSTIIKALFNLIKKYGENILLAIRDKESIVTILTSLLKEQITYKSKVLLLLSYFLNSDYYFIFIPYLDSENEEVVNAAVLSLKRVKNNEAIDYIINIFPRSNTYIKLTVIETLSAYHSDKIKKFFTGIVAEESDIVKIAICKLLLNYPSEDIKKLYLSLLKKFEDNKEIVESLNKILEELNKKLGGK